VQFVLKGPSQFLAGGIHFSTFRRHIYDTLPDKIKNFAPENLKTLETENLRW
jgi:hypothetical protein